MLIKMFTALNSVIPLGITRTDFECIFWVLSETVFATLDFQTSWDI